MVWSVTPAGRASRWHPCLKKCAPGPRPGWFDSPLAESWKRNPDLATGVLAHTAQRRWGAATDLAGAYQFLASDASAFVTGTVLTVDGGYLLV